MSRYNNEFLIKSENYYKTAGLLLNHSYTYDTIAHTLYYSCLLRIYHLFEVCEVPDNEYKKSRSNPDVTTKIEDLGYHNFLINSIVTYLKNYDYDPLSLNDDLIEIKGLRTKADYKRKHITINEVQNAYQICNKINKELDSCLQSIGN